MEHQTIKASEGKVFRRKSDGLIMGEEVTLGYTWYIGGKKLDEPLWELPEHYEEIDAPEEETETGGSTEQDTPTLIDEQLNFSEI